MVGVSDPMVDVSGNAPLTVTFKDTSTSTTPVISWLWNFGDGATSTVQNPTHKYMTPGIYNVSLETGNEIGVNVVTYPDIVTVFQPPATNITARVISRRIPLPVQFTSTSTGTPITSYKWNFGDGKTSTVQNPLHIYKRVGMYTVTLTVTGPEGTSTNNIIVAAYPAPIAKITVNRKSGKVPLLVHFTSESTGTISSYLWNFGDGQTSSAKHASHAYTIDGMYTATLTVTGPGGTSTKEVTIVAR
jgi:PKD repeat protein